VRSFDLKLPSGGRTVAVLGDINTSSEPRNKALEATVASIASQADAEKSQSGNLAGTLQTLL
jgi:hypothetical protein